MLATADVADIAGIQFEAPSRPYLDGGISPFSRRTGEQINNFSDSRWFLLLRACAVTHQESTADCPYGAFTGKFRSEIVCTYVDSARSIQEAVVSVLLK